MGVLKDLRGHRFGRLLVMGRNKQGKRTSWFCQCDCRNQLSVLYSSLTSGRTQSCGCLGRERSSEWMSNRHSKLLNTKPDAARNDVLRDYRLSAKRRNLEFRLSDVQFDMLIVGDCHYCGSKRSRIRRARNSEVIVNGIDRLDSSKGYTWDNCVSCCAICNLAKLEMSKEAFIEHCRKVAQHNPREINP